MSDFKIGDKVKCNCVDDWEESKGYESLTIVEDYHGGSHLKYDGRDGLICMCFVEDWPEDFNLVHEESFVLEQHPLESYPAKQSTLETRKDDKNMMHLVDTGFPNALLALGEVMSWAARNKGYLENDWKDIPEPLNAFLGAASRHRNKRLAGQDRDDESGLYHLTHEAFNVLAQLELKMLGKLDD